MTTASESSGPTIEGKVAIITGAASGIGAATARLFAKAGARLVLCDRNQTGLQEVAAEIVSAGGETVTFVGDVGKEATHKALVDLALKTYGQLNIAFNNAGVFPFTPILSISEETVDELLDTNLKGVIFGLKYQLPAIARFSSAEHWGSIVNTSSVLSTRVRSGCIETAGVYAATKSAVDTLTRFAALEGATGFVRVNSINPGFTISGGTIACFGGEEGVDALNSLAALVPRAARSEEMAQTALFLSSDRTGRFFNGAIVEQSGGAGVK